MAAQIVRKNLTVASCLVLATTLFAGTVYLRYHQFKQYHCCRHFATLGLDNCSTTENHFRYNHAVLLRQRGYYNEARSLCLNAVAHPSDAVEAKEAQSYLESGLPGHALDASVEAKYIRAMLLHSQAMQAAIDTNQSSVPSAQQSAESEKLLAECLIADPDFYQARASLAMINFGQGRRDFALAQLQNVLKEHPKYARGYYFLSQIYRRSGQEKLAGEAVLKAAELEPQSMF